MVRHIVTCVGRAYRHIPLYLKFLGKELAGSQAARKTVVWWPLIPAISVFLGTLNSPCVGRAYRTPFLVRRHCSFSLGTSWALLYRAWQTHPIMSRLCLIVAGFFTALCLMINFALIPLLLLCGLVTLLQQPSNADHKWIDFYQAIKVGIFFAIGFFAALIIYRLLAGYHWHTLIPLAMEQHLELERPYLPWVWLHTWDVVLFVGLPIFGLFIFMLFERTMDRNYRFALAVGLTLLIMVLSDTARGETGRVWMFFMPLFLLSLGALFSQKYERWERPFGLVQIGWLLLIVAVIPAVGTGLSAPPQYQPIAQSPLPDAPFMPVAATFGNDLLLKGFQAKHDLQNNSIILDLSWQARQQMAESYLFSILAVDPLGNVQSVKEWLPLDYRYPTTCWHPAVGEIHDQVVISLEESPMAGEWWLSLSAFTLEEESVPQYLQVGLANGEIDERQIGLGPVLIEP